MFSGITINLGGKDYVLPPMSLRFMYDNEELIKFLRDPKGVNVLEYTKRAVPIVLEALRRNYPELTQEDLWELLDAAQLMDLIQLTFSQSGFIPLGVAAPAMEAGAANSDDGMSSESSSTAPAEAGPQITSSTT